MSDKTAKSKDVAVAVPGTQIVSERYFNVMPTDYNEIQDFANLVAQSGMVPKEYKGKPQDILVAWQMGGELGIKPMQALQGIAVINGRPSIWGDLFLALLQGRPDFVDCLETFEGKKGTDDYTAVCTMKRRNRTDCTRKFSVADAKQADLWDERVKIKRKNNAGDWYDADNPSPWHCYWERMLQMRARAFAGRDQFSDVLKGLSIREEVIDIPAADVVVEPDVAIPTPTAKPAEPKPAAIANAVAGQQLANVKTTEKPISWGQPDLMPEYPQDDVAPPYEDAAPTPAAAATQKLKAVKVPAGGISILRGKIKEYNVKEEAVLVRFNIKALEELDVGDFKKACDFVAGA